MGGRGASSMSAGTMSGNSAKTQSGHDDGLGIGPNASANQAMLETAEYLGMPGERHRAYVDYRSVVDYTGSGYSSIRKAAREGKSDARLTGVEDFLRNAPQWVGGETRRGIELHDKAVIARIKVGEVFDVNGGGPASWSTDHGTARSFASNTKGQSFVFISKKQKRATSVKGISQFSHESEVLVSKETQYRILSVKKGAHKGDNRTYVEVEVLK